VQDVESTDQGDAGDGCGWVNVKSEAVSRSLDVHLLLVTTVERQLHR